MANKQIAGTAELTTGAFTPTAVMPVYQGENGCTELELTIYNNGSDYVLPVGASLRMYFYYETDDEMTLSLLMTVTGNVATCNFNDVLTALASRPKCVVRELDAENTTVICSFYVPVLPSIASTVVAVSPVTMDLLRPPYINTSDGHWYEWDTGSETYVDSGVAAAGDGNYVAFISQTLTDAQKLQARTNIGAAAPADIPSASDTNPLVNGTADPGTSDGYSRNDHVHPTDTTRSAVTDIKDNLTSTDTNKPLSANQGKALKALLDEIMLYTSVSDASDVFACDVLSAIMKSFAFTIADTNAKTVTLSNVPTGRCEVFLEITASATPTSVTWTLNSGSSVAWATGNAPVIDSGYTYRVLLITKDNGVTWDGYYGEAVA